MEEQESNMKQETASGIIRELGELPSGAVITEQGLAKIFNRHKVSIKRAVERGELLPSVRLFGEPIWTISALLEHLSRRLEKARVESEKLSQKINEFSA